MKKERGKFLTIMIVLAAFGILQSIYYLTNTTLVQQVYRVIPNWFPAYTVVGTVVGLAGIVGLWMMKKWAVYLFALSSVITFAMQLFVLKPVQYGGLVYIMTIISSGLWFWAIYRKWQYFD